MKEFEFSRRVFGNRCYFDQEATVDLDSLVSECNTEDEVRDYIWEAVHCSDPVLDRYASYWCEDDVDPIDEKEIGKAIQEWKKAKGLCG